MILRKFFANF